MERKRLLMLAIAVAATALVVWQVGFQTSGYSETTDAKAAKAPAKASTPDIQDSGLIVPEKPAEPEAVHERPDPNSILQDSSRQTVAEVADSAEEDDFSDSNEPLEAINLNNVEMKFIVERIAEWTGMAVIPNDEAMKQKLTIYAPRRLPRAKALEKIYSALRLKGYVAERSEDTIYIKPIADARLGTVPTIPIEQPLAAIENKEQVVQRFFRLNAYSPTQMGQIIQPLIDAYGYLSADETAGTLLVIDTVASLMRIETIINQFDVAQTAETVTEIFEVYHRDPKELVPLLQVLLDKGVQSRAVAGASKPPVPGPVASSHYKSKDGKSIPAGAATSVAVGSGPRALTLLAESRYNWIIAKGAVEDVNEVRAWIEKLDKAVPTVMAEDSLEGIANKNQVVQRFVKLQNCGANQMAQIIRPLMGQSGYVTADEEAHTLLLIDSVENLLRIEPVIARFDGDQADGSVVRVFEIHHREPEEIVQLLETLFGTGQSTSGVSRGGSGPLPWSSSKDSSRHAQSRQKGSSRDGSVTSVIVGATGRNMVLVPVPRDKWIIARASPEDIEHIGEWITKLDTSVSTVLAGDSLAGMEDKNQVVQRFITLQNCSPSRMAEIVGPLMGESGYVTVDEEARTLLLIDTVENLLRIEPVIARFDADQADGSVVQVFEIHHREPEEIVQLLETLFGTGQSTSGVSRGGSSPSPWSSSKDSSRHAQSRPKGSSRDGSPTSVIIGVTGRTLTLVPVSRNKWVIVRASPEDIAQISQWITRLDTSVPTVLAADSLDEMKDRNQVVQRFIELQNYSPTRMAEIVGPLMGDSGYVSGDEATGSLLVIDTVENLLRIESVIAHFDVAESEHTEAKVFEIHHREPDEIIRLLETLLGDGASLTGTNRSSSSRSSHSSSKYSPWQSGQSASRSRDAGTPTAIVGTSGRPIVLISDPQQKLIVAKASPDDIGQVDQWIQRLDRAVPTLAGDEPLTDMEDKNQIIQKCIKLQSFSPSRMADIILPLLSESGYASADEMTGNLLLIDTVQNLIRIEAVIAQFDVPEAEGTVTEIIEVQHSDPSEIVQLVRMLLSDGGRGTSPYSSSARYSSSSRRPYSGSSLYRSSSGSSGSNSIMVGPSQMPVVLIPESKRKWIIARASAQDMKIIREWVTKLDREEQPEREYETIPIIYADPREVATQLNQALQQMPGTELEASVLVQPLDQAKQIVVFGRSDLREMVKKLIEEIDVPPGLFQTEHFKLKYADPDVIERNINDLYGEGRLLSSSSRRMPGQSGAGMSADAVKVISHMTLKEVTVVASPGNMDKIRQQIAQWDVQIDVNEVKPRIIELRNSDTVQMRDLLTTLFSREAAGNRFSVYDYLFGFSHADKEKIIGPLYGQITFEDVPGTKKIIVISNIPGAYDVVEDLVRRLDQEEMAEVPKVIRLQYRNPETLAESLNAMFNETGTSATIRLSDRGLSDYSMDDAQGTNTNINSRSTASTNSTGSRGTTLGAEYRPWWTTGRPSIGQMPISNVIGRARFIPDRYSNSILALVPPEFLENITLMIRELDTPGKQVMIKAIIVQIDHSNMTSLGFQLSSDQNRWATLDNENAITARNVLSLLEKHGALVFGAGGDAGSRSEVSVSADVTLLIDFLVKELNAKILNQQTLWTKDNEEAEFFKGQRVGFQTRVSISDTGGRATSDYEYEKVGMTLRTRPSITPEKDVDMIINVVLSQLTPEEINNQRVRTEMDTTTNMIVKDGQTLMLGGMLFNEDSTVQRKLPLLGDLPLVGGLFRHTEGVIANSELLIFVTPYVVDGRDETLPETLKQIEQPKSRLREVQKQFEKTSPEETEGESGQ